ncbi:MAG TPA: hypothetical protein VFI02_08005 [Armatimonadota bacterium]|nr:hypothetical protein [Armatimonadota bacterium]
MGRRIGRFLLCAILFLPVVVVIATGAIAGIIARAAERAYWALSEWAG